MKFFIKVNSELAFIVMILKLVSLAMNDICLSHKIFIKVVKIDSASPFDAKVDIYFEKKGRVFCS